MLSSVALFAGRQHWDKTPTERNGDRVDALHNGVYSDPISVSWPIMVGKTTDVGTVKVWNDAGKLYVQYTTVGDWWLTETHVAVATSLNGIPQRNANPPPGQFPCSVNHNPSVQTYTYEIDLSRATGTELSIATHCVVRGSGGGGGTGWAGDHEFPGKNWAEYFHYTTKKVLHLPSGPVTMVPYYPGPNSYWQMVLSDVPGGNDVTDGTYPGWCVVQNVYMVPGQAYHPTLMSGYDPNLAAYAQDPDWDMVAYVINHKQGTIDDVQAAIWHFIDGSLNPDMPADPDAAAMVNAALAHGEGYYPPAGGWLPIVCLLGDGVQLTFIEVDP
jgi:hypothetical protein